MPTPDATVPRWSDLFGIDPTFTDQDRVTLPRFGTALDPEGYDLAEAIERHECRPAHKSHPNHCAHCYYPWPCPTVTLYRRLIGNA